jgi:DNA-binding LytR/AlgR family response regulator
MRIAICDDNPADARHVKELMEQFLHAHQYAAEIHLFLHPDELLATMEHTRFSLYLLDILMPMVNGIEAGRSIRLLDRTTQIIYVTGEARFALESFDTNPTTYLLNRWTHPNSSPRWNGFSPGCPPRKRASSPSKSSKGLRVLHFFRNPLL